MKIFLEHLAWDTTEKAVMLFFDGYEPYYCTIVRTAREACAVVDIRGGEKGPEHALKVLNNELLNGSPVKLSEIIAKGENPKG